MTASSRVDTRRGFCHEAFFYAGPDELVAGAVAFLEPAVARGDPALVAIPSSKIGPVRAALGPQADQVDFVAIEVLGRNPARLIAAWHDFLEDHPDAPRLWGIGEPVFASRTADELVECQRHEELLNVAFADERRDFVLLCPYDLIDLESAAVHAAHRSHPVVNEHGARRPSDRYVDAPLEDALRDPLPPPPGDAVVLPFDLGSLRTVRAAVQDLAVAFGLDDDQVGDLVLMCAELAANSVFHGGGLGTFRVWAEPAAVVTEVQDAGRIADPLVGRRRPDRLQSSGRGLFLVHQLGDLVQVRSTPDGTTVRVRVEHRSR